MFAPIPPEAGKKSAHDIRHHVPRVAGGPAQEVRADHLEENGPHNQVKRDLAGGWHFVVSSQPDPALKLQQRRQGAGNQQQIVEVATKKRAVDTRDDGPAINCIERTSQKKQAVPPISERFHSNARITSPNATATAIFRSKLTPEFDSFLPCAPCFLLGIRASQQNKGESATG